MQIVIDAQPKYKKIIGTKFNSIQRPKNNFKGEKIEFLGRNLSFRASLKF